MNNVVLVGRLTKDLELKFLAGSGKAVASGTIAVDRRYKAKDGVQADFIPIVVWGKQAENAANWTKKGSLIGVSGSIQVRSYEAKDGTKRYVTEVNADQVQFLDKKDKTTEVAQNNDYIDVTGDSDDSIPF